MSAPERFINRDLSWVEFNRRVLSEAQNPAVPLLERLKFLSIVGSNFDEFFMVRVASIKRQALAKQRSTCPTGMSPRSQLKGIHTAVARITEGIYQTLLDEVLPGIAEAGLERVTPDRWSEDQRAFVGRFFRENVEPLLTPVRVDVHQDEPPSVRNLQLHAAFLLERETGGESQDPQDPPGPHLALVQVPRSIKRTLFLPTERAGSVAFTFLEQVVLEQAYQLFPGYRVVEQCLFSLTRDADMSVDEERDEDFLEAMEQILEHRDLSRPVRMVINRRSTKLQKVLAKLFGLESQEVYACPDPVDLAPLMEIVGIDGFEALRDETWRPVPSPQIDPDAPVWQSLRGGEVMLHYPYESFEPVLRLLREAAEDPDTLAIKITLYRTSGNSPVVRALVRAAEAGKQVTVLVEVKARFDEERNIDVAQKLERAGAIVIHGVARLKVHSKALLITRREPTGIRRYVYLSTGNFNDRTATLYGDIGVLSSREELAGEVGLFFNSVTGYSVIPGLRHLVLAPHSLRGRLLELIKREARRAQEAGRGLIIAKMNSLADPVVIEALYEANNAGVKILLNVRGICMLIPGVTGMSEHIRVVSVIDRYLEHARIFHFENGGSGETWLASADWMPRNLDRRVELMFPIEDDEIARTVRRLLDIWFADTVKAHQLGPDQTWKRVSAKKGRNVLRAQEEIHRLTVERGAIQEPENRQLFSVRRTGEAKKR